MPRAIATLRCGHGVLHLYRVDVVQFVAQSMLVKGMLQQGTSEAADQNAPAKKKLRAAAANEHCAATALLAKGGSSELVAPALTEEEEDSSAEVSPEPPVSGMCEMFNLAGDSSDASELAEEDWRPVSGVPASDASPIAKGPDVPPFLAPKPKGPPAVGPPPGGWAPVQGACPGKTSTDEMVDEPEVVSRKPAVCLSDPDEIAEAIQSGAHENSEVFIPIMDVSQLLNRQASKMNDERQEKYEELSARANMFMTKLEESHVQISNLKELNARLIKQRR